MASNRELRDAIRRIVGYEKQYNIIAEVKSIDKEKRTCVVVPLNGQVELTDVRLQSIQSSTSGIYFEPAIGSYVIVGFIDENEAFIVLTEKIEEIEIIASGTVKINGDKFGGLVKINELKSQIEKNTILLKAIQNTFSMWVPVTSDGGAALKAASASFINLDTANLENVENEKIKHG